MVHHVQRPPTIVPRVVTPGSLAEALRLLEGNTAKPIAGGTDLLVELDRADHRQIDTLVDITRIPGLDEIRISDGMVTIGPLVTHNRCVMDEAVREHGRALAQACWEVGSPQLRNRATVVGNIVTASPANDTLSALVALDAQVTLASRSGQRHMAVADFVTGVRSTRLEQGELVTAVSFPTLDREWRSCYLKLGLRRAQAISVVHLAVVGRMNEAGDRLDEARIVLGSVAPTMVRAIEAEELVVGRPLTDEVLAVAAQAAASSVRPIDDLRASADYRTQLVSEMVKRALPSLVENDSVLPQQPAMLWGESQGRWPTGQEFAADHSAEAPIAASVNGSEIVAPGLGLNLLDWLRGRGLTGVKEGCAEGECGSCTVYLDGSAVLSCLVPAPRANRAVVTTIEGLDHPLQQTFIDGGAVQCGFCIPGFLMSGAKLLDEHPSATDEQIQAGLSGNLCRCTGYYKINEAVRAARPTVDHATLDGGTP